MNFIKPCAYTIGYAHHTQESFLKLIKMYQIQYIIDVRTMAYSKFHPQFNKEPLKYFLKCNNIGYKQMDEAFGIVRPHSNLLNHEGYLDFKKIAKLPEFKAGISQIIRGIQQGYRIAFMCAEKAPSDCHRSTLVARALMEKGYRVWHILWDGTLQSQEQLEEEIVNRYFPCREQINLFQADEPHYYIDRAYELRSNDIVAVNSKRVLKDKYQRPK